MNMIARVWRGRTVAARTDEYTRYLEAGLSPFRTIPGNRGCQMMRRTVGDVTELGIDVTQRLSSPRMSISRPPARLSGKRRSPCTPCAWHG